MAGRVLEETLSKIVEKVNEEKTNTTNQVKEQDWR